MSLANELQNLYTNTDAALKHCNDKLSKKKVGTATTLYEVGDKISLIKNDYNSFIDGSITEIEIPWGVGYIRPGAFNGCTNLENIDIPQSVTRVGDSAFKGCGITDIDLSNISNSIGDEMFAECYNLTNINLPSDGTGLKPIDIGDAAFKNCNHLNIDRLIIRDYIGSEAFFNCQNITRLFINGDGLSVDSKAFFNCVNLEKIIIRSSHMILNRAFADCSNLTSLILPNSSSDDIPIPHNTDIDIGANITFESAEVFLNTPIASGNGYIYVWSNMLSQFQTSSYWLPYASQFRIIEDYPEILTVINNSRW